MTGLGVALFGLDVTADFAIAGVEPDVAGDGRRPLHLARTSRQALFARWPRTGTSSISRTAQRVDRHPVSGVLLRATGWGAYRLSADGRGADCAPPATEPAWSWQRYLVGQVLPFAALLQGLEVLHASAVVLGGAAVAVLGPSGAGKSTLAAELVARGAELVADDVVALERSAEGVIAHPGPGLLSMRHGARGALGEQRAAAIGSELGRDEEVARLMVRRRATPIPLGAVVVLARSAHTRAADVAAQRGADPQLLLGASYNLVVNDPRRLEGLLDIAAAVARSAVVIRARLPLTTTPAEAADAVQRCLDDR